MKPVRPHLILPGGESFFLTGNISIGRAKEASILLEGPNVSRNHAHIYEIAGKFQIVDSESRNGTFLNGNRLRRPTVLKAGDRISIGGHDLQYSDVAGLQSADALSTAEMTIDSTSEIPTWLLLADLKNSSVLVQSMGLESYSRLLVQWFESCRKIIEGQGGFINKSTGDGLLAFWRDPQNQGASRVACTLRGMRELHRAGQTAFRVIVHYGNVGFSGGAAPGEENLAGPEVHFLFRMEKALGESDHVFGGTRLAADRLCSWIKTAEIGKFALKGFEGEWELFHLDLDNTANPATHSPAAGA